MADMALGVAVIPLASLYLWRIRDVRFSGPHLGSDIGADLWREIERFRHARYAEKQQYLFSQEQQEIEEKLQLDARSFHFIARDANDEIVGLIRLTPSPFELSELHPSFKRASKGCASYLEISRLLAHPNFRTLGQRLLLYSGRWAFMTAQYGGFIAICKQDLQRFMAKFGMLPMMKRPVILPSRNNGKYLLVGGSMTQVFSHVFTSWFRKRLMKYAT